MSATFNAKYSESGSLFQGAYKSKTVETDSHLRYLAFYIQVKNTFEMYPGGIKKALCNFDDAWKWACMYPYSSLSAYMSDVNSPIIDKVLLSDLFPSRLAFKEEAREMLLHHTEYHEEKYGSSMLEPW
jgi:hypothetical protein